MPWSDNKDFQFDYVKQLWLQSVVEISHYLCSQLYTTSQLLVVALKVKKLLMVEECFCG